MKARLSYTDKWDDDWFLDLPPVMKIVWIYLFDNCEGGTGFLKVSFNKLSREIGTKITREEFDQCFFDTGRIHWVTDETIWIAGFLKSQFKNLSPRNKAHVSMANNVISTIGHQSLSPRVQKYFDELLVLVHQNFGRSAVQQTSGEGPSTLHGPSMDPPSTLHGPSGEGRGTLIGYRVKGNVNSNNIHNLKYNNESSNTRALHDQCQDTRKFENRFKFDLKAIFDLYPRREKETIALNLLAEKIHDQDTYDQVKTAVTNYREFCIDQKREFSKILTFPNFWKEWRDWVNPENGTTTIEAAPDWEEEAQIVIQAFKKFGPDESAAAQEWLGEERWKIVRAAGGLGKFRLLPAYNTVKLAAGMLKEAFEQLERRGADGSASL